jgi:hypothetical protein
LLEPALCFLQGGPPPYIFTVIFQIEIGTLHFRKKTALLKTA